MTLSTTPTPADDNEERAIRWLAALAEEEAIRGLLPWPEELQHAGGPASRS